MAKGPALKSGPAARNGSAPKKGGPAAKNGPAGARKKAADGGRGAGNAPAVARRRNDAQASRASLVKAAAELFDARGYEGATIREIGDRAGVDTALIARYFGGKEGLYLAALAQDPGPVAAGGDPDSVVSGLLAGAEQRPHRPMTLAMVSPTLTDSLREQVRPLIESRLTVPLTDWLRRAGAPDPELRAQLLVGVAVGISLTRAGGTLPALSAAGPEEIRALLDPLIDEVRRPGGRS
ncbi:TetR family transcriptional regulator [Streptomyces sp. SL13]|uniref:TetR family transcriptional regulator n=1 Tax=Streptantibioticus silvisoli TaxID=2705255 RepID=A0AA90H4E0_9ACTN|nr:TetR/AcrR family transcriptional regulator [Streptantibioticus silvisoli]MDI5966816.1 TetR family transcriptional regulator [Streptantibioticus silvisoli]MDI5973908.1 TetR family transcriptional regulator [Streptantibioticus silvisoli]